MRKLRALVACCLTTALLAVPLAGPAGAQEEEPQFTCVLVWTDYVVAPGWSIWDLYELGDTWTIRGDLALAYAGQVTSRWSQLTSDYAACVAAYAEATARYRATEAQAEVQRYVDCVNAAAAPLLATDPATSRYVEVGLDGIVRIHVITARNDVIALFNCNGVFQLPT